MPSVDDNYTVYCVLGRVAVESDRFYHWPQWERCFNALQSLLADHDSKDVWTEMKASRLVPVKSFEADPPGMKRVTAKLIRMGKQRWSLEDNRRRSLLLAEPSEHALAFHELRVASSRPPSGAPDVFVLAYDSTILEDDAWNQVMVISMSSSLVAQNPQPVQDAVAEIGRSMRAVRICKAERPWLVVKRSDSSVDELSWLRCSTNYKSLELDSKNQTWTDLPIR